MKSQVIASFTAYNDRRYSRPWVCKVLNGKYDFSERVGFYTGQDGEDGDLIVTAPKTGQVYGYGQKDFRKASNTVIRWAKWTGNEFKPCDKGGNDYVTD